MRKLLSCGTCAVSDESLNCSFSFQTCTLFSLSLALGNLIRFGTEGVCVLFLPRRGSTRVHTGPTPTQTQQTQSCTSLKSESCPTRWSVLQKGAHPFSLQSCEILWILDKCRSQCALNHSCCCSPAFAVLQGMLRNPAPKYRLESHCSLMGFSAASKPKSSVGVGHNLPVPNLVYGGW